MTALPGKGPRHWTSGKREGCYVGKVFGMGRLLANSESFDFRSAGERADKSEDLQIHSCLMWHDLVEGSGPLRRLRGEGHQASRITSVKWVRRPAAAAGPPSNTPRNHIKNQARRLRATAAGKADGSQVLDRPSFSDSSDFSGPPENGPGNCWDTLKMQEPSESELNLGRGDLTGSVLFWSNLAPRSLGWLALYGNSKGISFSRHAVKRLTVS